MKIIRIPGYLYKLLSEYGQSLDVLLDEDRLRTILSEADVSKYRLLNHPQFLDTTDPIGCKLGYSTLLYETASLTPEERILGESLAEDREELLGGTPLLINMDVVRVGEHVGVVYCKEVKNNSAEEFYVRAFDIMKAGMSGKEISKTELFDQYTLYVSRM
jgi:hypothetical protein